MNKIIALIRLHKRAMLFTAAAAVSIGAIAAYAGVYHDNPVTPPAPNATTTSLPAPNAPVYPGRHGEDTEHGNRIYTPGPSTTADPAMLTVARKFAVVWARPDLGQHEWLAGVQQYGTSDYLRPLANIDPGNVPASKVTGPPTVVTSRTDQAIVDVPTDGGTLRLTIVSLVGQWWVSETEMLEAAA